MIHPEQSPIALEETLEESLAALNRLDLEHLLSLEDRLTLLLHSKAAVAITPTLLETRERLAATLKSTHSNLAVLTRLHARKEDARWEL
jgi:hypothetical protein